MGYSTRPRNTVVTPGTSTVPRQSRYSTGAPVRPENPRIFMRGVSGYIGVTESN